MTYSQLLFLFILFIFFLFCSKWQSQKKQLFRTQQWPFSVKKVFSKTKKRKTNSFKFRQNIWKIHLKEIFFFEGISIFLPILKCKWYDLLYKLWNLIRKLTLKLTVSLMHLKSHSTIISWTFFHLSALNPLSADNEYTRAEKLFEIR